MKPQLGPLSSCHLKSTFCSLAGRNKHNDFVHTQTTRPGCHVLGFPKSHFSEVSLSKLFVLCVFFPVKATCPVRAKMGIFGTSVVSVVRVTVGRWPPCSSISKQCQEIPGQDERQKRGLLLFFYVIFFLFFPFLFKLTNIFPNVEIL